MDETLAKLCKIPVMHFLIHGSPEYGFGSVGKVTLSM